MLEYKFEGDSEEFQKDMHADHMRWVNCRGPQAKRNYVLQLEFQKKYKQSDSDYIHNKFTKFYKICSQYPGYKKQCSVV